MRRTIPLFRLQELAFRTQYAELKERARAAGPLLPGSPGALALKGGTGHNYWYRVHYPVPGKRAEDYVGKERDEAALAQMRERIEFANWVSSQIRALRKLGFQVADKNTARVLVELHNLGAFSAGLTLVGTLAFMAWLNELGAVGVAARTMDIDLARPSALNLAAPVPFLEAMQATGLPFVGVPGFESAEPASSLKLPGAQGLRVDVLAPGQELGAPVRVPEFQWTAQAVPYYDYLLEAPESAAMLAGEHCIPVRVPQVGRFIWHKLYSSTQRRGFSEKAAKDRHQAYALGAMLAQEDPAAILAAWNEAPAELKKQVKQAGTAELGDDAFRSLLAECLAA